MFVHDGVESKEKAHSHLHASCKLRRANIFPVIYPRKFNILPCMVAEAFQKLGKISVSGFSELYGSPIFYSQCFAFIPTLRANDRFSSSLFISVAQLNSTQQSCSDKYVSLLPEPHPAYDQEEPSLYTCPVPGSGPGKLQW